MTDQDRVVVVGGGPVGMITALRLAQLDIPVVVLDAQAETPTAHRAATTHSSTLDLLDTVGITNTIIEQGLTARYFQYRYRTTNEVFAEFDFGSSLMRATTPTQCSLNNTRPWRLPWQRLRNFRTLNFTANIR